MYPNRPKEKLRDGALSLVKSYCNRPSLEDYMVYTIIYQVRLKFV